MEQREDGALMDAYGAIANNATGLGTSRDKLQYAQVNLSPRILQKEELEALYRSSRICEKAVRLLPEDAAKHWVEWQGEDLDVAEIEQYAKRIRLRSSFETAGLLGRLYGDAFVILGIDDGLDFSEPVDTQNIRSIRWTKALSRWRLQPDITQDFEDPEIYNLVLGVRTRLPDEDGQSDRLYRKIHKSRVLRFPGKRLFEDALHQNGGYNDSSLQAMFNDFNAFVSGLGASSAMIQDYSVFLYKLKGLSTLVQQGETEKLLKRFVAIQMGMSTIKGLMMDSDSEDASFVQRSFGGVKDILGELQDILVAASDMPRSKLLGGSNAGAFSEAGQSDRYEWADCIHNYQVSHWQEPLERSLEYMLLAQDSPTRGELPDSYGFTWKNALQLTLEEQAKLKKLNAESDQIYIRNKIYTPLEVRESRFAPAEYQQNITLIEEEGEKLAAPPPQPIAPNPPPVPPRTDGLDLERIRQDAIAGLVPFSAYWSAAGYDPEEMQSKLDAEFRRDTAKPVLDWRKEDY